MLSFAQDGWASTPDAQITTFFVNDMSAMMFSGTHMFSQINDAAPDLSTAGLPCLTATARSTCWAAARPAAGP